MELANWDPSWDDFKEEIYRVYMKENKTLKQTVKMMAAVGFIKSESQYEKKIKSWGWQKYPMSKESWIYANRRMVKRKREGRSESDVFINGILHPRAKVRKQVERHDFMRHSDQFGPVSIPPSPKGVVVCSPRPSPIFVDWDPLGLPWFEFLKSIRSWWSEGDLTPNPLGLALSGPADWGSVLQKGSRILEQLLEVTGPESVADIATRFEGVIPEDYPGQHLGTAHKLINSRTRLGLAERVKMELFLLSNNHVDLIPDFSVSEEEITEYRRFIIKLLQYSAPCLTQPARIAVLAVVEKLFANAVASCDLKTTELILKARMDPNIRIGLGEDVNGSNKGSEPLIHAIRRGHRKVAEVLLSHRAHVTAGMFEAVVFRQDDVSMAEMLLDSSGDVNTQISLDDWEKSKYTLLAAAARKGSHDMVRLLLRHGADTNAWVTDKRHFQKGYQTTALGIAARDGHLDCVKQLLAVHGESKPDFCQPGYLSPLFLAVKYRHYQTAELLIKEGFSIANADTCGLFLDWHPDVDDPRTLVETIMDTDNLSDEDLQFCVKLIDAGAGVDRALEPRGRQNTSALAIAARKNQLEGVRFLLSYKAQVNRVLQTFQWKHTALGVAIEVGNCEILKLLRQAGAITAGKVSFIGNIEAAYYLHQQQLLLPILQDNGNIILAIAIKHGHSDLVDFLLKLEGCVDWMRQASRYNLPVMAAVSEGNLELVKILIKSWPWPTDGRTLSDMAFQCLGEAIDKKNVEMVDLLLEHNFGDWWDLVDRPYRESMIERVAESRNRLILQRLLQTRTFSKKATGRALAIAVAPHGVQLVRDLLEIGPDLNQYDGNSETTLMGAIRCSYDPSTGETDNRYVELTRDLINAGVDVNYVPNKEEWYRTPLQMAVETGSPVIVNLLLENNANVNAPPSDYCGATAIQLAAIQGEMLIAQQLIELGANINAQRAPDNGRTALEGAAEHGRLEMLKLLIAKGAIIIGHGRSQYIRAVKLAHLNGHIAAAQLLKNHGGWTEMDSERYNNEDVESTFVDDEFTRPRRLGWGEESDDTEDDDDDDGDDEQD